MNEYVKLIRKYRLDSIILSISNLTRKQILENKIITKVELPTRFQGTEDNQFWIIPWDMMSVSFDSIQYTNDFRGKDLDYDGMIDLQNTFRSVDDEIAGEKLANIDGKDLLPYIAYGHSQEEFWMQSIHNETMNFNRNRELLLIGQDKFTEIMEIAFKTELGLSMEEYYSSVWILYIWGLHSSDYSDLDNIVKLLSQKYEIDSKALKVILDYYTGEISFFKSHRFGKNVFLIKPFVKTNSNKTILSSVYYLLRLLSFGAYWVVRNHYYKQDSQAFTNAFGVMYEEYFDQVLNHFLENKKFNRIEEEYGVKLVDWEIETSNFVLLVEQKTSLARMTSKTMYPRIKEMKSYFEKLSEGVIQLHSTRKRFESKYGDKHVVKLLVLFEELYVNDIIIESIMEFVPENIDKDVLLIGTNEFEILVELASTDEEKFEDLISEKLKLDREKAADNRTFSKLFEKYEIPKTGYARNVLSHYNHYSRKVT